VASVKLEVFVFAEYNLSSLFSGKAVKGWMNSGLVLSIGFFY
jgi:hypothetical protein